MILVAIAWFYVAVLMAVAEAANTNGTLLGALFTFLLYGLVPLSLVVYIMGAPTRKKSRKAREQAEWKARQRAGSAQPDGGGEAAAEPIAPVREEP